MTTVSNILVAVDGSKHASKAVDIGSQIAASLNVKLVLITVVNLERVPKAFEQFAQTEQIHGSSAEIIQRGGQYLLAGEVEKARAAGVVDIKTDVQKGPIARTIVAAAKRHNVDLIVLGARGMGDFEGGLLRGGVSHRVEALAKCSVLVVK